MENIVSRNLDAIKDLCAVACLVLLAVVVVFLPMDYLVWGERMALYEKYSAMANTITTLPPEKWYGKNDVVSSFVEGDGYVILDSVGNRYKVVKNLNGGFTVYDRAGDGVFDATNGVVHIFSAFPARNLGLRSSRGFLRDDFFACLLAEMAASNLFARRHHYY